MERLTQELGAESAQQLIDRIVPTLQRTYSYNSKRHSPTDGDDDLSFGVAVWRNATHLLGVSCGDLPDAEAIERGLGFEIELGGRTLRFYKMPPRLGDNIDAFTMSGSKVRVAQARTNDDQLKLEFDGDLAVVRDEESTAKRFPRLVVVHQGNPIDGLRWVTIGAPSEEQGWHWHERVYDVSWVSVDEEGASSEGQEEAPPASTKPLDIRLKPEALPKGRTNSQA